MKKRSFGITFVQILFLVLGIIGSAFLVNLFIPAAKVLFTGEGNLGEVIVTILVSLPFIIIFGPIVCICGIVTVIIAIRQRRNPEQKDVLALVFLILGIILIILPILMISLFFLGGNSSSEGIVILFR